MDTLAKILLALVALVVIIAITLYVNHRLRTAWELDNVRAPGQLVAVNGHRLHVYTDGTGNDTLVFIAGSGTSGPTLDFKPLWARLMDTFRVGVVERAGYGFSERAKDLPRDIDSILLDTRRALELAGEAPPYVLVSHSMGAVEAIHWAHTYPDEVKAIVGLDPAVPVTYETMAMPPVFALRALSALASLGLTRILPPERDFLEKQQDILTTQDRDAYRAALHRSTLTPNMVDEIAAAAGNATMVAEQGALTGVPILLFISTGEGVGVENWRSILLRYAQDLDNAEYELLDVGHYMHHYEPALIAGRIRRFLEPLQQLEEVRSAPGSEER